MTSTLYIIAGASCSGKSTLLKAWKADQFDLFGDGALGREALSPAEKNKIPIVGLYEYRQWSESGRDPAKNIVLHLDLSHFFKNEILQGGSSLWLRRVKCHYLSDQVPGATAISVYWNEQFAVYNKSLFAISSFSRLAVATIWCKRSVATKRKILRDRKKLQSRGEKGLRRRYVFSRLYGPNPDAEQNYLCHYQGWEHFLNGLEPQPARRLTWADRPGLLPALLRDL